MRLVSSYLLCRPIGAASRARTVFPVLLPRRSSSCRKVEAAGPGLPAAAECLRNETCSTAQAQQVCRSCWRQASRGSRSRTSSIICSEPFSFWCRCRSPNWRRSRTATTRPCHVHDVLMMVSLAFCCSGARVPAGSVCGEHRGPYAQAPGRRRHLPAQQAQRVLDQDQAVRAAMQPEFILLHP